ncbi:hypothetical protein Q1695_002992 [Nippostrongylus brasiliensis]|nr:hypothetical protein Q1695_002992 [Nippostrongylus brasiliensis]
MRGRTTAAELLVRERAYYADGLHRDDDKNANSLDRPEVEKALAPAARKRRKKSLRDRNVTEYSSALPAAAGGVDEISSEFRNSQPMHHVAN